ncbi:MAG: C25 family cysteine peptidase [Planctomycetaceae bacterium]|nr:C25 family cysteine peptidase [Planctomycetaceae bacterium]
MLRVRQLLCLWLPLFVFSGLSAQTEAEERQPDWLLITTPDLAQAAAPLIQRRGEQGFAVTVIDISTLATEEGGPNISAAIQTARQSDDCRVLILGTWETTDSAVHVPALRGIHGRMMGKMTDHGYGLPADDGGVTLAVGRLPARTTAEAKSMVTRILTFEDQQPKQNRIQVSVGHPGGRSEFERNFAAGVIRSAVDLRLQRIASSWTTNCIMDLEDSPYSVPAAKFGDRMQELMQQEYVFSVYSGHSSPAAVYSRNGPVVKRSDFGSLKAAGPAGVFLSCGCYSCQVEGFNGQGYGIASIRNPNGPVAVMGAFGESWAAHGQLAFDGALSCLAQEDPPRQLGDYWLAVQRGIARGQITQAEFLLYDMADGSGGQVPLDQQRLEHAEMWTLLGDPAMRIPLAEIDASKANEDGAKDRAEDRAGGAAKPADTSSLQKN